MHYGSIVGMTQYYRPACLAKKEERKSLVSFAEVDDTLLFDPSFPTQSLSCPDFNYDHTDESESEDEEFMKLPDPAKEACDEKLREDKVEKKDEKKSKNVKEAVKKSKKETSKKSKKETSKKNKKQTKQDTDAKLRKPTSLNECVQKENEENREVEKSTEKTNHIEKQEASVLVERTTDIVQGKSSLVERDNKEYVGSLFSFDAANEYVAPRIRSKETCMVIQRATDHFQKKSSTLERDSRQLGKAKNLVASRLAMFEARS